MNWWEEMALSIVLGVVHGAVKNPAKAASLRGLLLHIADSIYVLYLLTPPAHD